MIETKHPKNPNNLCVHLTLLWLEIKYYIVHIPSANYMGRMDEIGLDLFTCLQICQFISLLNTYQSQIYIRIQIPKKSKMRWCYVFSDIFYLITKVPSWSWSHGSWIYDYLCNQCLSPLTLWVRTPPMRGVLDTTLCGKVGQCFATGMWFIRVHGFPLPIKLNTTI